jgi:hypothetical protein
MATFHRECFQTTYLEDDVGGDDLGKLCVDPDEAEAGDIIAVVLPFATQHGQMKMPDYSVQALVAQKDGTALRIPWHDLVLRGLDQKQTTLLASLASMKIQYWCDNLEQLMSRMDDGPGNLVRYDLVLGNGAGALVRNFEDEPEGMDPDVHTDAESIQRYIDSHSAIAVAPYGSNHARLNMVTAAQKGSTIADMAASLCHPEELTPIYPIPVLA